MRNIPSFEEYEDKQSHPVTQADYIAYLRLNYKDELNELDQSENC